MAVVDANYKFLYVNVGANGRAHDAAVFKDSSLGKGIEQNLFNFPKDKKLPNSNVEAPYVFVADEAFKLTTRVLKPSSQRNFDNNKVFNYRLSRARRVVENAFGILANRFQIFQKEINQTPEKVEAMVLAACALHNFLRSKAEMTSVDSENTKTVEIQPGNWRSSVCFTSMETCNSNRPKDSAILLRDTFTTYFNGVGFVPWQWEAIKKFNF